MKTNLFNKIGLSIVLMVLSAFLFSKVHSTLRVFWTNSFWKWDVF